MLLYSHTKHQMHVDNADTTVPWEISAYGLPRHDVGHVSQQTFSDISIPVTIPQRAFIALSLLNEKA